MPDGNRLARLERARQHAERQLRLGFPDARQKLRAIQQAEEIARNGAPPPVRPQVIATVPEITEGQIEAARSLLVDAPDRGARYSIPRRPWRWWR
jgi:hypothetical protein